MQLFNLLIYNAQLHLPDWYTVVVVLAEGRWVMGYVEPWLQIIPYMLGCEYLGGGKSIFMVVIYNWTSSFTNLRI